MFWVTQVKEVILIEKADDRIPDTLPVTRGTADFVQGDIFQESCSYLECEGVDGYLLQHISKVMRLWINIPYIKIKRCSTETDGPHGIEASFKGVSRSCETTSLNGGSGSSVDCDVAI